MIFPAESEGSEGQSRLQSSGRKSYHWGCDLRVWRPCVLVVHPVSDRGSILSAFFSLSLLEAFAAQMP